MKKVLLIIVFCIFFGRIVYLNIYKKDYYNNIYLEKTNRYVWGESAPRGRILDKNGVVLVDNKGYKSIMYTKIKGISVKDEIEVSYKLANILDIDVIDSTLKTFYLITHDNGKNLISDEEYKLYDERKITSNDLIKLKYSKITSEMLDELDLLDKKAATIYDKMNKGYSYEKKVILKDIDDVIYSKIIESNIKGVSVEVLFERVYNYGDTLRDIFGNVSYIREEELNDYLDKGYSRNDLVGVSYLEKEYEDILKGTKDLYKVENDNTLKLIKEGKKGNDIYLTIDINVQKELESIIEKNILKAKGYKHTDYFSESYAIVGEPTTGSILALSGRKLLDDKFVNANTNIINNSYTVGSIVKMATVSTGYKYGIIDIGTSVIDGCVKLNLVPLKCSYKRLGRIDDLTAISKSSNYYQFMIAINSTGNKYKYNMKLDTNKNDFDKFRNTFKEYGLGSITGIDLPNEKKGITGSLYSSDLLLNLSIGQYDTYTPIELFQYVNTIASNGSRINPHLLNKYYKNNNIVNYEVISSEISLDKKYLYRIKDAMHLGVNSGTSRGYINKIYNGAGKTGTSETFIDTDNDGVMDTKTISIGFVGFAPYQDPKYSVVVLAPNIYEKLDKDYSKIYITRYISSAIMKFVFENE